MIPFILNINSSRPPSPKALKDAPPLCFSLSLTHTHTHTHTERNDRTKELLRDLAIPFTENTLSESMYRPSLNHVIFPYISS